MLDPKTAKRNLFIKRYGHWAAVGLSLIIAAIISGALWMDARRHDQEVLEANHRIVERLIQNEMKSFSHVLQGLRSALIVEDGSLTQKEYREYALSRDLYVDFPGAYGFGFVRNVKSDQLNQFIQWRRKQENTFHIKQILSYQPQKDEAQYVIELIEPIESNSPALGLNLASESRRRQAAEEAMRSGQLAMTHKIKLVQGSAADVGFLFFLPVYRSPVVPPVEADRIRELIGWAYSPVVMSRIMDSIRNKMSGSTGLKLEDVLGDEEFEELYKVGHWGDSQLIVPLSEVSQIEFGGRTWRLTTLENGGQVEISKVFFPGLAFLSVLSVLSWLSLTLLQRLLRLQKTAEQDRALLDAHVTGLNKSAIVAFTDPSGKITHVNKNFCTISGYQESELIGKDHRILNSGFHSKDFFKEMWRTISSGNTWTAEIRNRAKDGSIYWVDSTIVPLFGDDGNIEKYIAIRYDITRRKNVEMELRNAMALSEGILNGAPFSVISTDLSGTITTFNRAAEQMLGYLASEVVGKLSPSVIHDEAEVVARAAVLTKELGKTIEPGFQVFVAKVVSGPDINVWTYIRKDGSRFPVRLCVTAVRNDQGGLVGYMGIGEDISEQHRLNLQIEEQRLKLIHSSKMSTLGEMASGIAHEINNPLAIIKGKSSKIRRMVSDGNLNVADILKSLSDLDITADRIAKIIKGLRSFSRDSSNEVSQNIALIEIIHETLELCSEKFKTESIDVKMNLPAALLIECRPVQISQVFMNLLSNAADAVASAPEKWIEIAAEVDGDNVVIYITDAGLGIPPEVVDKMMNPFFTTKEVGKGTGLGLSISKGIIEAHRGELRYDFSSKHTRFVIRLPLRQSP